MPHAAFDRIFNHPGLRKILVRSRIFLGIIFVIVIFIYGRPDPYFIALAVSLFGELIQMWASSSLEKNKVLTVRGPYSLIRNPMYIGRFLVILGGIILLKNIYVILLYVFLFYFYMVNRVKREESHLREIFGAAYQEYCSQVNRFIPNFRIYEKGDPLFFRFHLLLRNNEHLNFLSILSFYLVFYVWSLIR